MGKLRYLTLGASATYGATLPDRRTGYPYQLSPNVTNLAIRASGPNYPSICTQSMIDGDNENNIYDVIILEYLMACNDGLDVLAYRLRKRFPDAIIIFNMMWVPTLITGEDNHGRLTSFNAIWQKHNFNRPITTHHISTITSEMTAFQLHPEQMRDIIALHRKIKNVVGGYLFGLDEINSVEWNNKDWVANRLSLFYDIVHYSQSGHDFVANGIKDLLRSIQPNASNNLGSWGDGDSCHMWYNTGIVAIDYNPKEEMKLNEFSLAKFALEIPYSGGELIINNPFSSPRQLMITYMTTGPSKTIYPEVELIINEAYHRPISINPLATEYRFNVHVAKTAKLDVIPPGDNKVLIRPVEGIGRNVLFPFRVVAISVLGDANPTNNFAPGPPSELY